MMTPGFSTAEKITTVSGRGVGMDVVKRDITAMRGDIEVSTEKGLGSIYYDAASLTLTVLDTLVVQVADNKYLIPINEVKYCYKEKHERLFRKKKSSDQLRRSADAICFPLREFFEIDNQREEDTVIVINKNETRIAVVVDGIIRETHAACFKWRQLLRDLATLFLAQCAGDWMIGIDLRSAHRIQHPCVREASHRMVRPASLCTDNITT